MATTSIGAGRIGVRAQGILVFCLSTVLLTVQDALTKLLTDTYTPVDVLFYRGGADDPGGDDRRIERRLAPAAHHAADDELGAWGHLACHQHPGDLVVQAAAAR
jgi:hypothetical protein